MLLKSPARATGWLALGILIAVIMYTRVSFGVWLPGQLPTRISLFGRRYYPDFYLRTLPSSPFTHGSIYDGTPPASPLTREPMSAALASELAGPYAVVGHYFWSYIDVPRRDLLAHQQNSMTIMGLLLKWGNGYQDYVLSGGP